MSDVTSWMQDNAGEAEFGCEESEAITFNSMVLELPTLDGRTVRNLEACKNTDPSPLERERAIWELAFRDIPNKFEMIVQAFRSEDDPRVRHNLLWLARKLAAGDAKSLVEAALTDEDREVRDWARLHMSHITGRAYEPELSVGVVVRGSAFDQTLPLEVSGFGVLSLDGHDRRVVLSPLWFEQIQGRVMACPRHETFMTNLMIEKAHFNYYEDGADHYELYPFAGRSWWNSEKNSAHHRYLATPKQRTYLSGKVGEDKDNYVDTIPALARAANTVLRPAAVIARDKDEVVTPDMRKPMAQTAIVSHVTGQYFGWGYASTKHFLANNDFLPGTVQLISPTAKETQHLMNWYMCGTFRGKTSDHNKDGYLDINETVCHGSPDGRLDYYDDGTFAADPHL